MSRRGILVLASLVNLLFVSISGAQPTNAKLNASMDQAFDGAMKAINEERGKNLANEFGCTQFFADFYRDKKIEPYVAFFTSRGVQAVKADANRQHYVSFTMPTGQLRTWGYRKFYRGDKLVVVFTTTASGSGEITSFSARLFGRDYP